jgi:aminoglycoside phosphotransferase (APT) family kinase protein
MDLVLRPAAITRLRAASGGFATSVWRVDNAWRPLALRVFRAHETHVLWRELLVLRSATANGLPVPQLHAVGSYEARPAMLTDWSAGRPLLETLRTQPWRVVQLGHAFGRLQRRMHRVVAPPGLRSDWIDWPRACEPSLASRLRALPLRTDRLLHMDYHPLNVLADGPRMSAIIDWTNAHAGDPRADLARTLTIMRLAPGRPRGLARLGLAAFEAGWRVGYGSFGPHMAPFYAWAGGAMLHDLAGRVGEAELEPVRRWTAAQLR